MTSRYYDLDQCPDGFPNIVQSIRLGAARQAVARQDADPSGTIRGGSVGAIVGNKVFGGCHRKDHLRFLGHGSMMDEHSELMTKNGEVVEEIVNAELAAAGWKVIPQSGPDSIQVPWEVAGVKGTMSADGMLADQDGNPVCGLEYKNLSGITTARDVHFNLKPQTKHIIQAANYAIRLGEHLGRKKPLPWALIYTSRVGWHLFAAPKWFKDQALQMSIDLDLSPNGDPVKVAPFLRVFYIDFTHDGKITYWTAGMPQPAVTPFDKESIDKYYKAIAVDIKQQQNLGPRPVATDPFGNKTFLQCDYCDLKPICDDYETDYSQWIDRASQHVAYKRNERCQVIKTMETMVTTNPTASLPVEPDEELPPLADMLKEDLAKLRKTERSGAAPKTISKKRGAESSVVPS